MTTGETRVLLLSRYGRKGPSSRLRHDQFVPRLAAEGIRVDAAPLLPDAYLEALYAGRRWPPHRIAARYLGRLARLLAARRYDLLWIEKELLPWLPFAVERALLAGAPPYVLDLDDAWFHHYDRHRLAPVRALLGSKLDRLMRGAALVTAGNAYLAERAAAAGAPWVEIVPTVVDLDRYPPSDPPSAALLAVGWIGSPATSRYLDPVAGPLGRLVGEGAARLVLIGAGEAALPGVAADRRPWREDTEVADLQGLDVGIMPLADSPWERGKCGYKLIQYMACGRPVVASPVGVNREIVEPGVNGLLAESPAQWEDALRALAADPGLRRRLGQAGRGKVERLYSRQAVGPRLAGLLRAAAGG